MSYDFNEAKTIFENKFITASFDEMFAFAKYSIHEAGNSIKVTEILMRNRLDRDGFNVVLLYDTIHKASLWAKKPLSKETTVKITEAEIDAIKDLPEDIYKVLFVALFLAKKDGNSQYYNRRIKDAVSIAGVRYENENERDIFEHSLKPYAPMITVKMSRKILYSDDSSETFIEINKKDNPMKYIPYFCIKCREQIEKKKHKMCDECYKEYRRNVVKISTRKYRVNS